MFKRMRKGQSTAEYAIVIGLVIAAAVAMQVYVKRGLQGKIKDAVDISVTDTNSGKVIGSTSQYEPYYTSTAMTATRQAQDSTNTATGGSVSRTASDTSSNIGSSTITAAVNQP